MEKRRPLKTRSNPLVIKCAKYLAKQSITPNQISLFSIVFGALAMLSLSVWGHSAYKTLQITFLVLAVIGIQGRLLCNLFDGMVAIEGGKVTPNGELYNDIPDRITDALIFTGLGLGLTLPLSTTLGLTAAIFSILTAYIRMLGVSMGTPAFFSGPLAKQHRMALLTIAILITIVALFFNVKEEILYITLIVINVGAIATCINRVNKIHKFVTSV